MRCVWDPAKRRLNLRKHGIDFAAAEQIFRGFTLSAEDARYPYGERRFLTLGLLREQVVSVVHTEQPDHIRIISIRQANRHEAHFFYTQIPDQSNPESQDS